MAKKVVGEAQCLMHKAAQKVETFVKVAQVNGPRAAFHYAATEYKCFVVTGSVKVWAKLDHHPAFHKFFQMAVPAAACISERYNGLVIDMIGKGYPVVGYLPLVPVEDIIKEAKRTEANESEEKKPARKEDSSSDSD